MIVIVLSFLAMLVRSRATGLRFSKGFGMAFGRNQALQRMLGTVRVRPFAVVLSAVPATMPGLG
jgi:hypothetical protein